ncbi:MAG: RNA polymerase sigma factor, partial [Candidatus Acidiferrales bacterium]
LVSLDEPVDPDEAGEGPKRDIGEEDPLLVGALDRVTLEAAIAQLPPGYRQVFLLHDVDGYEHNEIADMMDCSIGNSKSQLHKARLRLRELLKHARRRKLEGGQTPGGVLPSK